MHISAETVVDDTAVTVSVAFASASIVGVVASRRVTVAGSVAAVVGVTVAALVTVPGAKVRVAPGSGVSVGGTFVAVGGKVAVARTTVAVGDTGLAVGGKVAVAGITVAVGGTGVADGGRGAVVGITVAVGGTGVADGGKAIVVDCGAAAGGFAGVVFGRIAKKVNTNARPSTPTTNKAAPNREFIVLHSLLVDFPFLQTCLPDHIPHWSANISAHLAATLAI